ncbi:hypothetical protein T03_3644 [Trichinella britovi]|uniref:Uncharacterized protein n=1 Tax=Trichinella britovi TaxID=45882 RepID=A0A0V1DE98_TRIBR|nr:hypothetical protein T03_3644 [Trichinella britovi]
MVAYQLMEKVYDTACSQTVSDSGTDVSPTLLNFADRAGCGAFNVSNSSQMKPNKAITLNVEHEPSTISHSTA